MEDIFLGTEKEKNKLYYDIQKLKDTGLSYRVIACELDISLGKLQRTLKAGVSGCIGLVRKTVSEPPKKEYMLMNDLDNEDLIKALICEVSHINKHLWKNDKAYNSPFGKRFYALTKSIMELKEVGLEC